MTLISRAKTISYIISELSLCITDKLIHLAFCTIRHSRTYTEFKTHCIVENTRVRDDERTYFNTNFIDKMKWLDRWVDKINVLDNQLFWHENTF